jgi:hypothetical protein
MMIDPNAAEARHPVWHRRLVQPALLIAATAAAAYMMQFVTLHTIEIVRARHLLPQWDLATHLGHGWLDYQLLATGRIPGLIWDLWLQGYWPPGLSLYQVPFYLVLGGSMASGLWSTPGAFLLIALTGSALLWRQWSDGALLPASQVSGSLNAIWPLAGSSGFESAWSPSPCSSGASLALHSRLESLAGSRTRDLPEASTSADWG